MRRLLLMLAAAALLVGCGSSSSAGGVRGTELSYFPANAPFVLSVQTDPNSTPVHEAQSLIGRFPIATIGEGAVIAKLQQQGIDYQGDIRPLFGNPLMLGAAATGTYGTSTNSYLLVWLTKDASKLGALVRKLNLQSSGTHDGVKLYATSRGQVLAVDGATAVLGASVDVVDAALDRHAHGGGMSVKQATSDLSGLPQNTLVQAFGNVTGALSSSRSAQARLIPWVAAIRGYGVALSVRASGLSYSYRLDTGGRPLTPSQLPIAAGSTPPNFAGSYPITFALRDPAQAVDFVESSLQSASPAQYARFVARQAAVRARTGGVDLNSLLKLMTGDLIVGTDTRITVARAAVSDPTSAARDLAKLAAQPGAILAGVKPASLGGGFYAIKRGARTITIGVSSGELVLGRGHVSDLRAFAAAPTTPSSAHGSLAFRVSLASLIGLAVRNSPAISKAAQTILASLGDLTGSISASPSAFTGDGSLVLR